LAAAQGLHGLAAAQGLHGLAAVQGLHGLAAVQGLHGLAAAQGLHGLAAAQGLHGLAAAQGLHGLAAAQGLNGPLSAAICTSRGTVHSVAKPPAPAAQGLHGLAAAQGLQGLAAAQGLHGFAAVHGLAAAVCAWSGAPVDPAIVHPTTNTAGLKTSNAAVVESSRPFVCSMTPRLINSATTVTCSDSLLMDHAG
jgi:hypothetical protein